jgi:endo-1,4-beta-xylanase
MHGADLAMRAKMREETNIYADGLPDDVQQRLAARYADIFGIFLRHRQTLGRVTFWGVTDGHSWLNNFPVPGRVNYPLLWDRQGRPKAAFHAVVKVLQGAKEVGE